MPTRRRWCRARVRSIGCACRGSTSESVFAALLGEPKHGRWLLAPQDPEARCSRAYRGETGILETRFETAEGAATVIDFMPFTGREDQIDLIRIVRGDKGRVRMRTEIVLRFNYGRGIPGCARISAARARVAGPNAVQFITPVPLRGTQELTTGGEFTVKAGETVPFTMSWYPSHHRGYRYRDPQEHLLETENAWCDWSSRCTLKGPWREAIVRSLITLKMLTYQPTGGIVAAATTSLPEALGGVRNWDYRFCWIRDATLTFTPCSAPATGPRRAPGASGCCAPSRVIRRKCRSCTASPASAG